MVPVLHSYNHLTLLNFLSSGSLVELKCLHYIMVEADSHLRLLPASILDINKMFKYIDMISMGI